MTRDRDRCTALWQVFMGEAGYESDPDIRCQLPKRHEGSHRFEDPANDFSATWRNDPTVEDLAQAAWEAYRDARIAELVPKPQTEFEKREQWRYDHHGSIRRAMRKREFIAGYLAAKGRP
jgi:hypothetical protein